MGLLCGTNVKLLSGAVAASKPWCYESVPQAQGPQAVCSWLKMRPSSSQVSKTPLVVEAEGPFQGRAALGAAAGARALSHAHGHRHAGAGPAAGSQEADSPVGRSHSHS